VQKSYGRLEHHRPGPGLFVKSKTKRTTSPKSSLFSTERVRASKISDFQHLIRGQVYTSRQRRLKANGKNIPSDAITTPFTRTPRTVVDSSVWPRLGERISVFLGNEKTVGLVLHAWFLSDSGTRAVRHVLTHGFALSSSTFPPPLISFVCETVTTRGYCFALAFVSRNLASEARPGGWLTVFVLLDAFGSI